MLLKGLSIAALTGLCFAASAAAQTLTAINPPAQRVHDYVVLEGGGFGTSQGTSAVVFTDGSDQRPAGKAYVWRDNYIRIRVPVGKSANTQPSCRKRDTARSAEMFISRALCNWSSAWDESNQL